MIKISFLLTFLVAVLIAVSMPTKSEPTNCQIVGWERPTTYVGGADLPADRPIGYRIYFSTDPQPTKANATKIVDVTGPNSTSVAIPAEVLAVDGLHYVRGTAYNMGPDGELHSPWSTTSPFLSWAGKCYYVETPGSTTNLKLSSPTQ